MNKMLAVAIVLTTLAGTAASARPYHHHRVCMMHHHHRVCTMR